MDVELEQCFYSKRSVASVTLKGSGAKATATARRVGGVEGVQGTVKGELSIPGASTLVGAAVCTQEGCTLRLENTSLRNLKLKLSHKARQHAKAYAKAGVLHDWGRVNTACERIRAIRVMTSPFLSLSTS